MATLINPIIPPILYTGSDTSSVEVGGLASKTKLRMATLINPIIPPILYTGSDTSRVEV